MLARHPAELSKTESTPTANDGSRGSMAGESEQARAPISLVLGQPDRLLVASSTSPEPTPWWTLQRSDDCVIATAIHNGSDLRTEVSQVIALSAGERLREEDPFTGQAILEIPTHVIVHRSRFEIDLNRALEDAVYRVPQQSWGLHVWRDPPDDALVEASQNMHRDFYSMFADLTDTVAQAHGRFVVLDVHSYNCKRNGADAAPMPEAQAPEVNIGTFSMPRRHWGFLLDPLLEGMRKLDFGGRHLDVRENVAFEGRGELTRFVHARHPRVGCAIALEFRKFFMDEWTGIPDPQALLAMRQFVSETARLCRSLLHG